MTEGDAGGFATAEHSGEFFDPRGVIERNAIALLSNYNSPAQPLDPPSLTWLGLHADRGSVRLSGLWNVNHVTETYDPIFLDLLEDLASHH